MVTKPPIEQSGKAINTNMRCFHPEGIYVWDTWYYEYNGEIHCTFLQQARPDHPEKRSENGALGHAVSRDMLHWEHRPSVLYPGEKGSYDDGELWTACTYVENGRRYMYYTCNHWDGEKTDEAIGLAISDDGKTYTRHPESPVISCDAKYYINRQNLSPLRGHGRNVVDCRDLCVVKDPDGNGYWGYFAARVHAEECVQTSVIALAHSEDLVHWTQMEPCFKPDRYACVEVPEVFYKDGKWWMLCLTGNMYGQRFKSGQPEWIVATIQAVADHPWGPFREIYGHEIIGSSRWEGFSSKTLEHNGKRYMFYTQGEDVLGSHFGSIALPSELIVKDDHLVAAWCEPLEGLKREVLFTSSNRDLMDNDGRWGSPGTWNSQNGVITGSCKQDWSMRLYEGGEDDVVMEGYVTLNTAEAAGFVLRASGEDTYSGAYEVLLDANRGEVLFTSSRQFLHIARKSVPLEHNREYHLRVVAVGNIFTVYLDDVLTLQLFDVENPHGRVGVFTECGEATFRDITVHGLVD